MTAITDLSDLVNLLTGGGAPEHLFGFIDARIAAAAATAPVVTRWTSLWRYNSTRNPVTALPGAANIPTRASPGALKHTNAAIGKQKWLLGVEAVSTRNGTLMLYDRLFHMSGLSGTSLAAQTVQGDPASPALTRYNTADTCKLNQIFIEINTQIGATGSFFVNATYFDQDNNLSTTPNTPIGGTGLREAERLLPLPLAVGDVGVRGVKEVTLTGSTGTAGDFGVIIARPFCLLPCQQSVPIARDFLSGYPSMDEVVEDACLAFMWQAHETTAPQIEYNLHMVEK